MVCDGRSSTRNENRHRRWWMSRMSHMAVHPFVDATRLSSFTKMQLKFCQYLYAVFVESTEKLHRPRRWHPLVFEFAFDGTAHVYDGIAIAYEHTTIVRHDICHAIFLFSKLQIYFIFFCFLFIFPQNYHIDISVFLLYSHGFGLHRSPHISKNQFPLMIWYWQDDEYDDNFLFKW